MSPGTAREGGGRLSPADGRLTEQQPFRAAIDDDDPPDLAEALGDLNCLAESAKEEGDPIPSNAMLAAAETMLRRLYGVAPHLCLVGTAPEGEVDIYALGII